MAIVGRGEQPARALPAGAASAANFPATCLRHWFPDKSPRGRLAGSLTPDQEHLHVPPRRPGAAAQFTVAVAASLPQAGDMLGQRRVAIITDKRGVWAEGGREGRDRGGSMQ